jgi:hypothetical protein
VGLVVPLILAGEAGHFTLSVSCDRCRTEHEVVEGGQVRQVVQALGAAGWFVDVMSGTVRCPECSPLVPGTSLDPRHWGTV